LNQKNTSNNWEFGWFTKWEEIEDVKFQDQWYNWLKIASNSHVFFHPLIANIWIKTYLRLRNLKPFFCIAKLNSTILFLPLVLWQKNWKNVFQKVIVPVGYSDYDYHDPIIIGDLTDQDWNLFWEQLPIQLKEQCNFDKIEINGIRLNCRILKIEDNIAPFSNIGHFENSAQLLKSLSISLRGDINRQMRRLNEIGNLSYFMYNSDTLNEALTSLPEFLERHHNRWQNAYKAPDFHYNLINDGLKSGIVHFSELRLNNNPVSWHLGFVWNNRFYYYMPVIDQAYANYSPGKIHIFKLMEDAIEKKLLIFDHLRGDENYKAGWAKEQSLLYQFISINNSFHGRTKNWFVDSLKQRLLRR